jgi:RNA polymerase sigma factor (sigma-70 family)
MKKIQRTPLTAKEQQTVTENIGLVYAAAKHFNNRMNVCDILRIDWDDYISLLYIALCKTAKSYDPSRRAAFITAFWVIAENEIKNELAAASRYCRRLNYTAYSLDYIVVQSGGLTLGELITDNDLYTDEDDILTRIVLLDLINRLPEAERKITTAYYMDGKKQSEIGAECGVSNARIGKILQKVKDKLKKELEAS